MGFIADFFADGAAGGTPMTAAKLNNLEQGELNADVTNSSSAAAIALAARFALLPRPSTIPTSQALAYRYNPEDSAYNVNPGSLVRARAAIAKAMATGTHMDIAVLGTSLSAGTGSATKAGSWPSQLHALLTAAGYPSGGAGFIASQCNNSATTDPRVVFSGAGWSAFSAGASPVMQCTGASQTATFTDTEPSTQIDIWYLDFFTIPWTYSVDGAAAVTVTNTATGNLKKVSITGLSSANHNVVINSGVSASGSTTFYVMGVTFKNATGIAIHNVGIGGITANTSFDVPVYSPKSLVLAIAPQLTFIELGANEPPPLAASFTTLLQSNITALWAAGSDVVIIATGPTGVPSTTRPVPAVLAADYALADANNVPLIDFSDRLISWTSLTGQGLGFTSDGYSIHLTAAGYAEEARAVFKGLRF